MTSSVWGNFLRIDTLRFRPAYMRVAEARSTIGWRVRRAPEPVHRPRQPGKRRSSRHSKSRSFVLASLWALHLDLEPRRLLEINQATNLAVRRALKPVQNKSFKGVD